jgi:hypothetical protein
MIAVFINNKLISTDTILPIVMELHEKGDTGPVVFYTASRFTYDEICLNTVLFDAIQSVGHFRYIGAKTSSFFARILSRLMFLPLLLRFLFLARMKRLTIIHFGILDVWPFRILYYFNRRWTVKFEQAPIGFSTTENKIANIKRDRKIRDVLPAASLNVGFLPLGAKNIALDTTLHPPELSHPPVFRTRAWNSFVERNADSYLRRDFERANVQPSEEILTFMLGFFGKLDFLVSNGVQLDLFHQTMEVLLKEGQGRPIFLKPHVITDRNILADALSRYKEDSIIVSNLHASVLASRSRLFVCNYYSTTLSVAKGIGVPTIEFSGYSDKALALTNGKSMRPELVDHFVNLDREALAEKVQSVLATPSGFGTREVTTHEVHPELSSVLLRNIPVTDLIQNHRSV